MKNWIWLIAFFLVSCATSLPNEDSIPKPSDTAFRTQLESHVWEITQIASYLEMEPKDYFTLEFKGGDITFGNVCGGFWGKYHFESDNVLWLEMWDLGQNACSVLVKAPDGSTQERSSPANYIQSSLKRLTGRYDMSFSDEYTISLSRHITSNAVLTLGRGHEEKKDK